MDRRMVRSRPGVTGAGWRSTLAVAMVVFIAPPSLVHTQLERAEPAVDSTVAVAPERLRLVFNESIDPQLATVTLEVDGVAGGPLADLASGDGPESIVGSVPPGLPAGVWTVRWQVVGADGHPVTDDYRFTVESARMPEPDPDTALAPPAPVAPAFQDDEPTLTVESPAWVAARWITFAAMLTVIGAVAFHFLVLRPTRPRLTGVDEALDLAGAWGAHVGRGAALFLALASGVRALLQVETLGGFETGLLGILLFQTSWGLAWWVQVVGAVIAAVAFHLVVRGRRSAWGVAALAAGAVALGASLSSHAAASDLALIAVTADALHILSVSAWLGTLLVLMSVGIPAVMAVDPRTGRFSAVAVMVSTFSPRALAMAGIGAVTGSFAALIHLPSVPSLWQTDYGRTLLVKVLLVGAAAAVGMWNWKRMKPGLEAGDPPAKMRRTAALELLVGALILLATAVLVAVPTP